MNIKFGMDNYLVRYLKRFLNSQYGRSNKILGKFQKEDLQDLINYLNLPNVKPMTEVQREIIELFPQLHTLFSIQLKDDVIVYASKQLSTECSEYIHNQLNNINNYCLSVGWELDDTYDWYDTNMDINSDGVIDAKDREIIYNIANGIQQYDPIITKKADINLDGLVNEEDIRIFDNYISTTRLYITIKKSARKNYFPNKDMLVFVNQFDGSFMYNYAIRNGEGYDNLPHIDSTESHKIALYKCKPGQKITIAHNSNKTEHLVIGCSSATLRNNIPSFILQNVQEIDLKPGEGYQYTTTSKAEGTGYNANYVCIQCPSDYSALSGYQTATVLLRRGDINFDGKIDMIDYHLLARYTAEGPGSEELHWNPTPKQLAVMDIPIPGVDGKASTDGIIDVNDAIELYKFITGQSTQTSLGLASYTYNTTNSKDTNGDNVENLLIIDGHYDRTVNIPFEEFTSNDWIIHEKFFNYLLGMSIHKYSDSEDITYVQKLLKERYPEHYYDKNYFYPGKYSDDLRDLVKEFQESMVYYDTGDLNRDGKINGDDLILERSVIEYLNSDINGDGYITQEDFTLLSNYLNGTGTLTPKQLEKADINFDGVIDNKDLAIIQEYLQGERNAVSKTQINRADINKDGTVNKLDYQLLQAEVNGTTNNLKNYNITFMLGWVDVQTEATMEQDINFNENISEVSK